MTEVDYPNIKLEVLGKVLEPWLEFIDKHNISDGWDILLFFVVFYYFTIFRRRRKKGKYTAFERIQIGFIIILAFYCVVSQAILIVTR
jgi:hypothetical protein